MDTNVIDAYFQTIVPLAGFTPQGGRYYLNKILGHVEFANRRVLDIGGGRGIFSYYAACMGASDVVCLEPQGDGSSADMIDIFRRTGEKLPQLGNVRLELNTIQQYEPGARRFDVVLLHASINHLDEEACARLHRDSDARAVYRGVFSRIAGMCAPGAELVACDVSRLNVFGWLGRTNPMAPDIEWHKHQPPRVWADVLSEAGFCDARVTWGNKRRKNALVRLILNNRLASYFQTSQFCLRMKYCPELPAA